MGPLQAAQINLQAADGNIYALAGGGTRTRATGTATRDGHVWLVADTGGVTQGGTISALNANGGGGIVDTQARVLSFVPGAQVLAYPYLMAVSTIVVAPVLLLFFLAQRTFIEGISVTGIKG